MVRTYNGESGKYAILPHPKAPTYSNRKDVQAILSDLISEVSSPNFSPSETVISLIRETGIVNLWFYLKYICSITGPYGELNEDLHLDMCNFRQSPEAMKLGARAAGFIPRGHFKSTCWTHGASGWILVRNPDAKIVIANAISSKAQEFKTTIQNVLSNNPLHKLLYPWTQPRKDKYRWNAEELVVKGRSKDFTDPSLKAIGATGAAEGGHFTDFIVDDLVGLADLTTTEQGSGAGMQQKKNWFNTNSNALLKDWITSRIFYTGTRYSIDDAHSIVLQDTKEYYSYVPLEPESFPINEKGDWSVYVRFAEENGEMIFPESFSKEKLKKLAATDYWTYITQYMNDPQKTGLAEFSQYQVKKCRLVWDESRGEYLIKRLGNTIWDEPRDTISLKGMDVCGGADPAGTDSGITSKTSRSALSVWAEASDGQKYLLWGKAGYMSVYELIEAIFTGCEYFAGYIRTFVIESNAMQKILLPIIRRERARRERERENDLYVPIEGIAAKGDKDARIRSVIGSELQKNTIWVEENCFDVFDRERKIFPQSKSKKDFLDCSEKALSALRTPASEQEMIEIELEEEAIALEVNPVTGY